MAVEGEWLGELTDGFFEGRNVDKVGLVDGPNVGKLFVGVLLGIDDVGFCDGTTDGAFVFACGMHARSTR